MANLWSEFKSLITCKSGYHYTDGKQQRLSTGKSHSEYAELTSVISRTTSATDDYNEKLKEVNLLVMDNSLRESTVGQLRGHTIENKFEILDTVNRCGFRHVIVSAFSHMPRVDDTFVEQLCAAKGEDLTRYFAFSEIGEGEGKRNLPVGLRKMKQYGLQNPIIEIDLAGCDDKKTKQMCQLLLNRMNYTFENLSAYAKIGINLRDFPYAMAENPDRVFDIVRFLANQPMEKRPFAILYEEPTGNVLPETLGGWTRAIRTLMDSSGWKKGHLLTHVHEKWGFGEVAQLACLAAGADGIWASVCQEGAGLGHACSSITIMNIVRMGNTKVLKKFNCSYLREAATVVTKITTGGPPPPKIPVYGERALDIAFDFGGIAGGQLEEGEFDMAKFFGVVPPKRISTLASPKLVKERLVSLFGPNEQFTDEVAEHMLAVIIEDLNSNRKEEYMSHAGLAVLFDRAGGKLTGAMSDLIAAVEVNDTAHKILIDEVRTVWDEWDSREEDKGDECLEFYSFYNAFMMPYFSSYESPTTRKAMQAIDMDDDGLVDWNEFLVYLKWALHQYPDLATADELVATAFQKAIIPAMQDEVLKQTG